MCRACRVRGSCNSQSRRGLAPNSQNGREQFEWTYRKNIFVQLLQFRFLQAPNVVHHFIYRFVEYCSYSTTVRTEPSGIATEDILYNWVNRLGVVVSVNLNFIYIGVPKQLIQKTNEPTLTMSSLDLQSYNG